MRVQIRIQRGVTYTGRKSHTGRLCFDENGRMCVFVDYCPDCKGKVIMSTQEAKRFADIYSQQSRRIGERILRRISSRRTLAKNSRL